MIEDVWDEMVEKYGIHGYDNTCVIINYETLIKLKDKAERLSIYERQYGNMVDHAIELEDKLKAIKKWFHRLDTAIYNMSISPPPKTDRYTQVKSKALRDTMLMRDRIKDILETEGDD